MPTLLIGNEAYATEIGRLTNPHNDVGLLEQALKGLSFETVIVHDAGLGSLTRAVNAYARRLQAAGPNAVGFFYYSGHGASDGSTNYLIPVDVKTTETGELWDESLRLTEITRRLKTEAGNATHFVVFDACRNTLKLIHAGSRAVVQSKGFVPVAQENGMLIAYATAEGELATDVGAGAGPYARALAEEIIKPGIEAVVMFRAVQRRVRAAIHQEPYLGFNALGDVYFAGKPDTADMHVDYELAERINTEAAWELFIKTHKAGYPVELARERLRLLHAQAEATANAKRHEEERMAAEQRAQEEAEAKRQAEAAAAKKRAAEEAAAKAQAEAKANAKRHEEERMAGEQRAREEAEAKLRAESAAATKKRAEAAAKAQAEAKAKAQRLEDERGAAEQRAHEAEAARVEQRRLATVAPEAEAAQKSTTVVAASSPEPHASQQTKQPTKLVALPKLEVPHITYDGTWAIVRLGPTCRATRVTFEIRISGGIIRGHVGSALLVRGSIATTGAFQFTHPSDPGSKTIYYVGTIKGSQGDGTFSVSGDSWCHGTFTVSRG
jgi:uncharacterized caspase-like protein